MATRVRTIPSYRNQAASRTLCRKTLEIISIIKTTFSSVNHNIDH
jgi:hypothetical protein